jgi:hypothetical protein
VWFGVAFLWVVSAVVALWLGWPALFPPAVFTVLALIEDGRR